MQIITSALPLPAAYEYTNFSRQRSYGAFLDPDLDEAWIIVPMSLRITGYSAPSLPGLYHDRPTIHVEGEMGGAGWIGSADIDHDDDIRRVHGTVSMLASGEVRWSIVRGRSLRRLRETVVAKLFSISGRRLVRRGRTGTSGRLKPCS